jgi:hypothetical protein
MILETQYPENWLHHAKTRQFFALNSLNGIGSETLFLDEGTLNDMPIAQWALIRVSAGRLSLFMDARRQLTLEAGDCWIAYAGSLFSWVQDSSLELEVWKWDDIQGINLAEFIFGFGDLMLELARYKDDVSVDPMPGFEFFRDGDTIISQGDTADSVYTLIEGKANVLVDGTVVGVAHENEILGLQAMLLKTHRTASVVATGSCTAVKVSYDNFRLLIEARPQLVISTMETMAQQLARANERLLKC